MSVTEEKISRSRSLYPNPEKNPQPIQYPLNHPYGADLRLCDRHTNQHSNASVYTRNSPIKPNVQDQPKHPRMNYIIRIWTQQTKNPEELSLATTASQLIMPTHTCVGSKLNVVMIEQTQLSHLASKPVCMRSLKNFMAWLITKQLLATRSNLQRQFWRGERQLHSAPNLCTCKKPCKILLGILP